MYRTACMLRICVEKRVSIIYCVCVDDVCCGDQWYQVPVALSVRQCVQWEGLASFSLCPLTWCVEERVRVTLLA